MVDVNCCFYLLLGCYPLLLLYFLDLYFIFNEKSFMFVVTTIRITLLYYVETYKFLVLWTCLIRLTELYVPFNSLCILHTPSIALVLIRFYCQGHVMFY